MKEKPPTLAGCCLKLIAGILLIGVMVWITYRITSLILPTALWKLSAQIGICVIVAVLGIEVVTLLLGPGSITPFGILGLKRGDDMMKAMQAKGMVVSECFSALRAFEMEDIRLANCMYFIELSDGRVLFLSGQYLFDYFELTEEDDAPEGPRPRTFPCTEFVIHRHRRQGWVLEIECKGNSIEPSPKVPFPKSGFPGNLLPSDGEIIETESFNAILAKWQAIP